MHNVGLEFAALERDMGGLEYTPMDIRRKRNAGLLALFVNPYADLERLA